jgi:hypothetical protein
VRDDDVSATKSSFPLALGLTASSPSDLLEGRLSGASGELRGTVIIIIIIICYNTFITVVSIIEFGALSFTLMRLEISIAKS